jgi:2-polyprenyl-3-methyl-5-hydroxy-6-metoxy-1,4-benzoquinol methylase
MVDVAHDLCIGDAAVVYGAVNRAALECVPTSSKRILDLGCGTGALGRAIKSVQTCEVVGVTHSAIEATAARAWLDHVEVADLNDFGPSTFDIFDCIICSHVLEHLESPERLLKSLIPCIAKGGALVVALPNALFWRQRLQFLGGRFEYTDGGLMDRTHLRFFDWNTAAELVHRSGYEIDMRFGDGGGLATLAPSGSTNLSEG